MKQLLLATVFGLNAILVHKKAPFRVGLFYFKLNVS